MKDRPDHRRAVHKIMRLRSGDSPTLALMKRYKCPITRAGYLHWTFGDSLYSPNAEEEAELPEEFQFTLDETELAWDSEAHTLYVKVMTRLQ